MTRFCTRNLHQTWLLLLILSAGGMAVFYLKQDSRLIAVLLLAIALIKARLVLIRFMGLRREAPALYRGMLLWCAFMLLLGLARLAVPLLLPALQA